MINRAPPMAAVAMPGTWRAPVRVVALGEEDRFGDGEAEAEAEGEAADDGDADAGLAHAADPPGGRVRVRGSGRDGLGRGRVFFGAAGLTAEAADHAGDRSVDLVLELGVGAQAALRGGLRAVDRRAAVAELVGAAVAGFLGQRLEDDAHHGVAGVGRFLHIRFAEDGRPLLFEAIPQRLARLAQRGGVDLDFGAKRSIVGRSRREYGEEGERADHLILRRQF